MKLNLGCSDDLKPGYVNVDNFAKRLDHERWDSYQQVHLNQPWPWEDSSVDEIYAHDVFEHISPQDWTPSIAPKIWCMNESWRVLKPGGLLDLAVPCVMLSDGRVNPGAFADPTHQSYWTLDDRYYFGEEWNTPRDERGRFGVAYGITALFRGAWILRDYGDEHGRRSKIFAKLEAVK